MRRDDVRRVLVCYDIPDDKRRGRLAKLLESYGDRVQYSVFIVDVSPASMLRLKDKAKKILSFDEDSVLFCDLGLISELSEKKFSYLGRSREITDNNVLII